MSDWMRLVPGWMESYYALGLKNMPYSQLRTMAPRPYVHTNLTGKKAGWCAAGRKEIALNPAMTEEQAYRTFAHELAHYFAYYTMGDRGHGNGFRMWMEALGHVPSRCHNYANLIAQGRGDWYHCSKCHMEMKSIKDLSRRFCRKCNPRRSTRYPMVAGRPTTDEKFAKAFIAVAAENPEPVAAMTAVAPGETTGMVIRGLLLELGILRDGGMASSPQGAKIRRALRKLGHRGGCSGE